MEIKNLPEIMSYILKELNKKGNPDTVMKKFSLTQSDYKSIVELVKLDGYIECDKTHMDGALNCNTHL